MKSLERKTKAELIQQVKDLKAIVGNLDTIIECKDVHLEKFRERIDKLENYEKHFEKQKNVIAEKNSYIEKIKQQLIALRDDVEQQLIALRDDVEDHRKHRNDALNAASEFSNLLSQERKLNEKQQLAILKLVKKL